MGVRPKTQGGDSLALHNDQTKRQSKLAYLERHRKGITVLPGTHGNEGYQEAIQELSDETKDMQRAITSLMQELEAVDWYNQKVDACKDSDAKPPRVWPDNALTEDRPFS